ncbi:MAG: DoxX family protein [Myxococcales bacterium]|nr:DoxX family protein [Myxococcales bacterium]
MERIDRLRAWLESHRDLAFELLRIYLGVGLLAKGVWFVSHSGDVLELLRGSGWEISGGLFLGHFVAFAHLAGGLLVALGLATRLAAAVQVPVLVGAIFFVHLRTGFFGANPSLEFALLVLFLLCLCVAHGGGRLSLDAWFARTWAIQHPTPSH